MTEEIAEATTKYLQETPGKINFFGGEPLLNMTPIKMMLGAQYGKTGSRSFGVTTNGTLLKGDTLDWLRHHKVDVALSFDGSKATQDLNRSGTYRTVVRNAKKAMELGIKINVLKVMYPLETMYDDVVEIRNLGFKNVYLNLLKPHGFSYQPEDLPVLEEQYMKTVRALHHPPQFTMIEYVKYGEVASHPLDHGCGIGRQGKAIGPDGYIYPCIDGPLLGQEYAMGSVWHGIDPVRERRIRQEVGKLPEKCMECTLSCNPCNITSFLNHGEFGVQPDEVFCQSVKAMCKAVSQAYPKPTATPIRAT